MWCKHARPLWGTAWQFLKQVSGYPGCTSKRVKSRDLKRRPYARNRSSIHDQKATPPDAQRQVKERRAPPGGKQGSADTLTADAWAPRSGRQQTPAALRRRCPRCYGALGHSHACQGRTGTLTPGCLSNFSPSPHHWEAPFNRPLTPWVNLLKNTYVVQISLPFHLYCRIYKNCFEYFRYNLKDMTESLHFFPTYWCKLTWVFPRHFLVQCEVYLTMCSQL